MSGPYDLTSIHNPRVASLCALLTPKGRAAAQGFLIEGPHLVQEALRAHLRPDLLLYDPEAPGIAALRDQIAELAYAGSAVLTASATVIARASDAHTPQGIVATLPQAVVAPDRLRAQRRGRARPILLILDAISDPGNVGTILRTALAADVDEVLLSEHCADPFAPKVLRSASGAHFHLPLRIGMSWDAIAARIAGSPKVQHVALADAHATTDYTALDLTVRTALIVSNEAHGPSAPAQRLATHPIRIPMFNDVESLNAAVAASILLFEGLRQRRG